MAIITETGKKLTVFNARGIEEEWLLIEESEKDYQENGGMSLEESYLINKEKIKNLGNNIKNYEL